MELEMEVFNKVNNKVSYDGIQGAYVSFGTNNIRFSSEAVRKIGMKVGQYVHFVKIGKDWFFTVNDDTTGYRLSKTSNGNGNKCGALRIWCIPFREHFVKDIGRMGQKDIKFYINPPHSTLT